MVNMLIQLTGVHEAGRHLLELLSRQVVPVGTTYP